MPNKKTLIDLLPTSRYGYQGKKPAQFDLGPTSTIDNTSSIDGKPAFSTYGSAYLRRQQPTKLSLGNKTPPKYLDNPPQ